MAILPVLLAGLVLRRLDSRSVSVWLACRDAGIVSLSVREGRRESSGAGTVECDDQPIATDKAITRRLDYRLHLARVRNGASSAVGQLQIEPPLHSGALYCYDSTFQPGGAALGKDLKPFGLLADDPLLERKR